MGLSINESVAIRKVLLSAAASASDLLLRRLRHRRRLLSKTMKSRGDFLTEADLEAQETINSVLRRELPKVPWVMEENPETHRNVAKRRYITADPLDGTHIAVLGATEVAVQIAFVIDGVVEVAVIQQPLIHNTWSAIRGDGAFLNGAQFRLHEDAGNYALVMATPFSHAFRSSRYDRYLKPLIRRKMIGTSRAMGCAAANVAELLSGRLHAYVNVTHAKVWDLAPGALIVQEAGGCVFTPGGRDVVWKKLSQPVVFTAGERTKERILRAWGVKV